MDKASNRTEPSAGSTFVLKRDGRKEKVFMDKITSRISKLCYGLHMDFVDPLKVAIKVVGGIYNGVTTVELDNLAAEVAASMTVVHPDYAHLAARIAISNLHKQTKRAFSEVITDMHSYIHPKNKRLLPMISDETYEIVMANADKLNSVIIYDRDFSYTYFGFKTLERSYLLKINGKTVERPQHMLMRVAIGIHKEDIDAAIKTYNLMSEKWFTHASPTMFNAGTCRPQLASCFLLTMVDDSIEGICQTLNRCAYISKSAGGVGLNVHKIRASGSFISGTNGTSNGLVPMLRVFNAMSRYVDQGGNKRPGSFAIYLEPWHADIMDFLELRKNTGSDEERARDLFYALWIPDLFMKRVKEDKLWSLMCPNECPGLDDCWGKNFEDLYQRYEDDKLYIRQLPAREVWKSILTSQTETGTPYMVYKDACNRKSNQQNVGTIKCSNLCTEIIEYSSPEETAVCNLASIALPRFVMIQNGNGNGSSKRREFDFQRLKEVTKVVTQNLNKVIDVNYYPTPDTELSNKRHRPIGIGIQGLADTFMLMRFPFVSEQAQLLNKQIFETIYFGALEASCELAEKNGTYETYEGSPVSKGVLQYDMWEVTPTELWDWTSLKKRIAQHGVRNSLLVAPMPTASTAQILGNNESIEPYTANIYSRRVLSGDFQIVNPHLMKDLIELNLWNEQMKNRLIAENGSVQNIPELPSEVKELYRTVWEIPQKDIIQMAADRSAFIDQSQSLNLHIAEPTYAKLTSMHFHAWSLGLKTGMYYLRTRPAVDAVQFTVDKLALAAASHLSKSFGDGTSEKKVHSSVEADEHNKENQQNEPSRPTTVLGLSNKYNRQQQDDADACLMCSS